MSVSNSGNHFNDVKLRNNLENTKNRLANKKSLNCWAFNSITFTTSQQFNHRQIQEPPSHCSESLLKDPGSRCGSGSLCPTSGAAGFCAVKAHKLRGRFVVGEGSKRKLPCQDTSWAQEGGSHMGPTAGTLNEGLVWREASVREPRACLCGCILCVRLWPSVRRPTETRRVPTSRSDQSMTQR